jgi:acyl carrier protein
VTPEEVRRRLLSILGDLAPEADLSALDPRTDLRRQLDIDSFGFLTLMVRVKEEMGIDVPDADHRKLLVLDSAVEYLAARSRDGTGRPEAQGQAPRDEPR